jgi:hypothetical protein
MDSAASEQRGWSVERGGFPRLRRGNAACVRHHVINTSILAVGRHRPLCRDAAWFGSEFEREELASQDSAD